MTSDSSKKADFRAPSAGRRLPRAVADGAGGIIVAVADVAGSPEQVFRALTTNEVEQWWRNPGVYRPSDWQADGRVCGPWSVTVEMTDGKTVYAKGEFCELDPPRKIVMTRTFDDHPFLGPRETTITYRVEPSPDGTLVTVRDEGFIGRSQAAYGNAEIGERVLAWLDEFLRKKTWTSEASEASPFVARRRERRRLHAGGVHCPSHTSWPQDSLLTLLAFVLRRQWAELPPDLSAREVAGPRRR